jgi:bifunctional non-homologous end joining protein LigD
MLAKETEKPFDDKDWLFEIKWDGYRAVAEIRRFYCIPETGLIFQRSFPS